MMLNTYINNNKINNRKIRIMIIDNNYKIVEFIHKKKNRIIYQIHEMQWLIIKIAKIDKRTLSLFP